MNRYKHILVALDFTDSASSVLNRAIEIRNLYDAELTLLHSVECSEAIYTGDLVVPLEVGLCEELAEQAETKLAELATSNNLTKTSTVVTEGVPKQEVLRVAKEKNADLIVLGSHGRHGLQLLLGSTANGVLHMAECDVLAVRVRDVK